MISHDNYTWVTDATVEVTQMLTPDKVGKIRVLSLLPLSHVAAQLVDLVLAVRIGMNVFFTDPSALQGNLVHFLKACKPYSLQLMQDFVHKCSKSVGEVAGRNHGPRRPDYWLKEEDRRLGQEHRCCGHLR